MSRRRRAILIESGNITARFLRGASEDQRSWGKYLQSSLGGWWSSDEIISLPSCPKVDMLDEVLCQLSTCEYAFITFSGHGGYDIMNKQDFIFLNNSEIVSVNHIMELLSAVSVKSTIIIDACRTDMLPPVGFKYTGSQKQGNSPWNQLEVPVYRDVWRSFNK